MHISSSNSSFAFRFFTNHASSLFNLFHLEIFFNWNLYRGLAKIYLVHISSSNSSFAFRFFTNHVFSLFNLLHLEKFFLIRIFLRFIEIYLVCISSLNSFYFILFFYHLAPLWNLKLLWGQDIFNKKVRRSE